MIQDKNEICGTPVPLIEARDKVTGRCTYVDDRPTELHAKILRSPHPHARIKGINTKRAEKLEGVRAVLTHNDVPRRLLERRCAKPCYVLDERVRYAGDEVAAVAAKTKLLAEEALGLIEVDYEILTAVFDPEDAAKSEAPRLYPKGNVYGPLPHEVSEREEKATAVLEWGNIQDGFRNSAVIVEDRFDVKPFLHTPIETHACIAKWRGDELNVWTATHCPYEVRNSLAQLFEMPLAKVRVISEAIGGGFGSKYTERYQAITALLSKKARGVSTKLVLTREEEQCHAKRGGCKIYIKLGAGRDGKISGLYLKVYFDIGAYGNHDGGSAGFWGEAPVISYKAENARFEAWDVHTNHISSQPLRSIHLPNLNFAFEQVVDQVAEKLELDPVEFRMRNMPVDGDIMPPKPYVVSTKYRRGRINSYPSKELMTQVTRRADFHRWNGWKKPLARSGTKRRGIGLAYSVGWSGFFWDGFMSMAVVINWDGSAHIVSGAQDLGTGLNTTLCMLAAESLGISPKEITISSGDTGTEQHDLFGARSSRSLTMGGHLLLCAIEDAKNKIRGIAAHELNTGPEAIVVSGKIAYVKDRKKSGIPLSEFLTSSVIGTASGPPRSVFPDTKLGSKLCQPQIQVVEVEVDVETGEVKILRIVTGNSPGKVINPEIVRGQYTGGAIQAMGWALFERFDFDERNSTYLSCNLTDYKVPRALDVPIVENVILERASKHPPDLGPPYGAMGVGELGCGVTMAAIANAIYNAIGVRIKNAPMTAELVLEALTEKVEV